MRHISFSTLLTFLAGISLIDVQSQDVTDIFAEWTTDDSYFELTDGGEDIVSDDDDADSSDQITTESLYGETGAFAHGVQLQNVDYSDHLQRLNPSGDTIHLLSPTPTPLDISFVLESMNAKRSDVANGKVLHFGNTPIYAKNMQSFMWDEALSIIAAISIENICQNDEMLTDLEISDLFREYEHESAVAVSDRLENIKVGTTRYIVGGDEVSSHNNKGIILQALDSWMEECDHFMYGTSCEGHSDDASKCANCLQLIWSQTRYTGCALDKCSNEDNGDNLQNDIIFLCHYYWSADLGNDDHIARWQQPFDFGLSDNDICASCSDTEQSECDPDTRLCVGSSDLVTTQSPTSWSKQQIMTVLNTANSIRSYVANGIYTNGINSNGLERWIWSRALAETAYCTASRCDESSNSTDPMELAMRFVAANDRLSGSERLSPLVLPEDLEQIRIGETRFRYDDDQYSISEIDVIFSKALDKWVGDCQYYNAIENRCHGGDESDCSECIQMLWADTRYIGCGYSQCGNDEYTGSAIEVVCHYYQGAGKLGLDMPLTFGRVCSGCESRMDRNECEGAENLCYGCPAHDVGCEESGITEEFYEQICPELNFSSEPTQQPTSIPTIESLYGETGAFAHLFTDGESEKMSKKRIRKEIRDISDDQWDRIVDAMNIMKYIPEDVGKEIYGDYYRNYDNMVCQHYIAAYGPSGDMAHLSPVFDIWHRALILSFENSLIAIDPEIEGVPYWDWRRDQIEVNDTVDLSDSIIFSDEYFGDYHNDVAVKNGRFRHWTVNDNPSEVGCGPEYQNAFGLLRARDNAEGNPSITRYGGSVCGGNTASTGDMEIYDFCLNNVTNLVDFVACADRCVHGPAHTAVGGTRPAFEGQTKYESTEPGSVISSLGCVFWHQLTVTVVDGVGQMSINDGCLECPEPNSCTYDPDDLFANFDCAACDISNITRCKSVFDEEGVMMNSFEDRFSQHNFGDFLDKATSPNDPLFMFHHNNVDRYYMEWQLRNYDDAPYYGYPETGYLNILRLNDTLTPDYPFEYLFYGEMAELLGDGPYTARDIWDGTTFVDAVYVFDTVLDMVRPEDLSTDQWSTFTDPRNKW